MKHTLFFFGIFTLLTCLSACDNGDKNVIIARKEFVNHVQKTFDDPRTLKEIVDIFPADTISVDKLREMLHLTQKNCSLVLDAAQLQDSLTQDILNINNLDQRKVQRADFSTRIKILSLAESMIELVPESLAKKRDVRNCIPKITEFIDSLQYEAPIYGYQINYRAERADGLKLETQYAYIDSLKGFLKILPQKMEVDDYSDQLRAGMELSKDVMTKVEKLKRVKEQELEDVKQIQSLTALYSKDSD